MRTSVRWALVSLSLAMVMPSLDSSIANVSLPALADAFDASFQAVQWIALAYLLAITPLIVSAGRLGDVVGRRRLLLAGIGVFTAASLACGLAPTLGLLIAARAAQGAGAAAMLALTMALVGDTVPKERTGAAMGLLGTMSAIGTTVGPSLGGLLMAACGWRAIFLVNVPVGLVTAMLAYRYLPVDGQKPRLHVMAFDPVGTVLMCLTLAAYGLATTVGRDHVGPLNIALLLTAIVGVGLFGMAESRAAAPLIEVGLFRDRVLRASLAMSALVAAVMMTTLVVGPFYLCGALGLPAAYAGVIMSVGPLLAALAGVPGGRLVDRLGASRMTLVGLVVMAFGCISLTILSTIGGIGGYVVSIVLLSSGYALFQAANNTIVMMDIGPDQRGVIAGLLLLARNLGLTTGVSVIGTVFAHASASAARIAAHPDAVALGMRTTFAMAAMLIIVAGAMAIGSRRGISDRMTIRYRPRRKHDVSCFSTARASRDRTTTAAEGDACVAALAHHDRFSQGFVDGHSRMPANETVRTGSSGRV